MSPVPLSCGDLLHLTRAASVQFAVRPIVLRLIRFERQVDSIVDFAGHRQALAELMADYLRMGVAERRSRGLPDDP
ncbi:hypothetical protein E1091_03780, partial [Micromonospora fluostatini]